MRHVVTFLALLSLLLCLAAAVLWVRSYWVADRLAMSGRGGSWSVESNRGHFRVTWPADHHLVNDVLGPRQWNGAGAYIAAGAAIIPHWMAVSATAVPGVLWLLARARRPARVSRPPVTCENDLSTLAAGLFRPSARPQNGADPLRLLPEPVELDDLRRAFSSR